LPLIELELNELMLSAFAHRGSRQEQRTFAEDRSLANAGL